MENVKKTTVNEFIKEISVEWENMTEQTQGLFCRLIAGETKPMVAVNLEDFIGGLLDKNRVTITNGMTGNELKAYDLAITNCMSAVSSLFTGEDEVVVCTNRGSAIEEVFPEEIL